MQRRGIGWLWLMVLAVGGLGVVGCNGPEPTPPPVEVVTVAPSATPTHTPTAPANEEVANAMATEAAETMTAALTETATPMATAIALVTVTPGCSRVQGWLPYTVQAGDSFDGLALLTGSETEVIMAGNCRLDFILRVGEEIYLPSLPPVMGPVYTVADSSVACSAFRCPDGELGQLPLPAGHPGDPTISPCDDGKAEAYLDEYLDEWGELDAAATPDSAGRHPTERQHGERVLYFVCNFPDVAHLEGRVIGPAGERVLPLTRSSLYSKENEAPFWLFTWNISCDLPAGPYTISVGGGQNEPLTLARLVKAGTRQQILTVPKEAPAGTTFLVYFCHYPVDQPFVVDFFVEEIRAGGDVTYTHSLSFTLSVTTSVTTPVTSSDFGWAVQTLPSLTGDPSRSYFIRDNARSLKGDDIFWIVP